MVGEYFQWLRSDIMILCFDKYSYKSCYSFDGKLNYIGDSNYKHVGNGLAKYKEGLLTVGDSDWSVVGQELKFAPGDYIWYYSLSTVVSSDINEEYVLLIGGENDQGLRNNIFKFNGTWFSFSKLNKPRRAHNSIYWNGAVYRRRI